MNNYAISSDGIAIALQDSASALMEGGNSLEQAVALVASANKVVQDPNSVGSALRTISLRLRGTSVKVLQEMGEETDGVVASISKMQEKIKALTGVDILTDSGAYKETYTILKEIGTVWEDMSDIDQAALLELMAGKNRANTLAAILGNMEDLEGAYNDALQAEGSALKENEAYLDSIQGRIDLFNNSLQTMWMNFIDSEVVKFIVDLGTALVKLVDNAGLLTSLLTTAGGFFVKKNWGDLLFGKPEQIKSTTENLKQLQAAVDTAQQAFLSNATPENADSLKRARENLQAYQTELDAAKLKTQEVGDASVVAGTKSSGAFKKAAKSVGTYALQLAKSMAIMYAVSVVFELIGNGINWLTKKIKENSNSIETLNEKYQNLSDQLSSCESELKSLESELETTNEQIEELLSQGALSFAEQEELERLQAISAELERQIAMKQALQGSLQTGTNAAAINAGNAYLNTSFDSEKSKTERQEEAEETGKAWGKAAGLVLGGLIGLALAPFTGGTSLVAFGVGAGVGAGLGDVVGGVIGSSTEGSAYDQEQTVANALETMNKTRDRLIQARDEAYAAYASDPTDTKKIDEYNSAAQALSLYDEKMANHISQMSQYYNTITSNWDNATADQKKTAKEYGDILDKYTIEMGGVNAKSNAIERIFGTEADGQLKSVKTALEGMADAGEKIDLKKAFGDNTAAYDDFVDRLYDMGIYVYELEDAFYKLEVAERAAAEVDFTGIAKDISGVTDAVSGIKSAYEEFLGSGYVLPETILGLQGYFTDTEELATQFEEYARIMMSGSASAQEAMDATAGLAQSYLEHQITLGKLTSDQKAIYATQLKALGITNADEFIEHELQKSAITAIESAFTNDNTLTSHSEAIQNIIDQYGVELGVVDDLIAKLKEKQNLEFNAKLQNKELEEYRTFANEYQALLQDIEQTKDNIGEAPTNPYDLTLASTTSSYAANPNAYPSHSYAGAYAANATNMPKAYIAPDGSTMYLTDTEYADMVRKYEEYEKQVQELQDLWNKVNELQSFGINKGWVNSDGSLKEGVDAEFEKAYNDIKADIEAKEAEIDAEFTLEYDLKLQDKTDPNTLSALQESVDKYKSILAETAEVVADGQVVTEEYKASLVDLGISINDLNTYFDENNPLVVKNAKGLRDLVDGAKKNTSQNIKLAKSQAQLEYYELTKELTTTLKATDKLDDATKDTIKSTLKQIDTVKLAIYQYEMLEDSLLGATNAFEEFAKAQEIDAMNTYGDSYVEMAQTMYDAIFKTGEVGSEAFWAAVEATVPDNVYKKFYEEADQLQAVIDYLGTHVFPTLTLEEDQFSLGYESMEDFVQECLKVGVFVGDLSNFDLADGMNFEKAIELLDMTEAQAYALFSTLDKFNGNNSEPSFLMRLDDSLAGRITLITSELEELNRQKLALLEDGITADEQSQIDAINKKLNQSESAMNSLGKEAYATWQEYTQNEAALAALSQIENKQDELTADGAAKLGIELEEGQVLTVQQAYDMLLAKKLGLEEPCVLTAQLAIDNINSEIANIESTLNSQDFSNVDPVSVGLEIGASTEEIKTALNEKLQGLKEDKLAIATEFNIELPEEEKQKLMADLGAVEEFTINDKEFAVIANGISETQQALQSIQDFVISDKSYTVTRYEQSKISGGGNGGSSIFSRTAIAARADGTAHADGSWGAPKTETALVGELGPELLVRNGRWTTIGDNGAEFTQVKKGDIIFNHKQTEDLLSKGHITGRGKAYASGTAYSNMFGPLKPDDEQSSDYGDENGYVDNFYDNLSSSAEAAEEFEEALDWIEVRLEEWDELLGKLNAQLENAVYYTEKNNKINEIIAANQSKLADLKSGSVYYENYAAKYLAKIPAQYQDMAKNGSIAITDFVGDANEEVVEAIQKYRDYIQKAADLTQQAEEILTEIRDLAIQKIDNAYDHGSVRTTVEDSQTEKIQNQIDLLEEMGEIASSAYYGIDGGNAANSTGMFENSYKKIEYLTEARNAMQKALDEAVLSGQIVKGSNEWYEQIEKLYGIDSEIDEATLELEQFRNAINDIYWDNFDQLISRIDYLKEETQSLIDLMANDDLVADPTKKKYDGGTVEYWTADDVQWTDEGLASLGLYAQQMEMAEYAAKQYAEAIKDLEADYAAGLYSESEYLEKLNELKEAQYENIEAYYEAQDAIVELNKARVDSIKEGIEAEIDAYAELIEKKKEALDTEKDLYDFQKDTAKQQKNIAQIERQLAALANDHSLSAAAKRKQLEAELAEAQYDLQDTYYNRSVEDKQAALDKELEDFQSEKELEIQKWEEYLTNVEQVIAESLGVVQANASGIYDTLNQKADEYNINLSDSILAPWQDGALAVSDYQETFDTAMSSTMNQLEALKNKWQEVIDTMTKAAKIDLSSINAENERYTTPAKPTTTTTTSNSNTENTPNHNSYTVQKNDNLWNIAQAKLGNALRWREIYELNKGVIGSNPDVIRPGQKLKLPKYAKGTTGVKNNQLAWIDEMGLEEVVLHAGDNGRLTYLSKGSAVLPSDISSNLMQLGSLDPQDILDRSRPRIIAPHITNNEIKIDMSIGEVVHIDTVTNDTIPDLTKAVQKQMDSYMSKLNNAIKAKVR